MKALQHNIIANEPMVSDHADAIVVPAEPGATIA